MRTQVQIYSTEILKSILAKKVKTAKAKRSEVRSATIEIIRAELRSRGAV